MSPVISWKRLILVLIFSIDNRVSACLGDKTIFCISTPERPSKLTFLIVKRQLYSWSNLVSTFAIAFCNNASLKIKSSKTALIRKIPKPFKKRTIFSFWVFIGLYFSVELILRLAKQFTDHIFNFRNHSNGNKGVF